MITLVVRIYADCSVGHDGLRTGSRNDYIFVCTISVSVRDIISQMIEMTLGLFMYYFLVTDCSMSFRIPVNHTYTSVNQSFLVEIHESVDHRLCKIRVHGELGSVPVA